MTRAGWALLLSLPGLAACAGSGVDLRELPEAPIAFVLRTREEADRRAEMLERRKQDQASGAGTGVARLEDVGELLGVGPDPRDRMVALLGHLALLDPRTRETTRVEAALGGARPLCWSPDHQRLLFASLQRSDRPQLFEYRRATGEVRPVTRGPQSHPFGAYGPDDRLALVRVETTERGPEPHLYVTGPDGQNPRALVSDRPSLSPTWSAAGPVIAFESRDAEGNSVIASVSWLGDGEVRVIARGKEPTFTPDGAWIVYSARSRGHWRLWRMRPDGTGKMMLGGSRWDEHDPSVAPDGRFVLFVAEERDSVRQHLVVRPMGGSGGRKLLDGGEGVHPAW